MIFNPNDPDLPPTKDEVRKMLERYGFPLSHIAEMLGMRQQAFDYHIRGSKRINPGMYKRILQVLDELTQKLVSDGIRSPDQETGNFFPILKSLLLKEEEPDRSKSNIIGQYFIEYPKVEGGFAIIFHGDQMTSENGQGICDGDILLLDPTKQVISGDVALILLANGRELVRQYIEEGEEILLHSCNKSYPNLNLSKGKLQKVWKVVVRQPKTQYY